MAGFLGMGGYAKPGKGVKRNRPEKKRFFQFFELYFRKFGRMVLLNLLYLLYCLPVVTIGPATAALMQLSKYYCEEKPVFLLSDFWAAFKSNFKQGLIMSLIDAVFIFLFYEGFLFYYARTVQNGLYWIPMVILVILAVLLAFMNFYAYLMMVSIQLNMWALLKNSFMMCALGAKTNWLTLIFTSLLVLPSILFFPLSILLVLTVTFSMSAMIVSFNSFQYIYRYLIKPYYDQSGLENPYERKEEYDPDEVIFRDMTE